MSTAEQANADFLYNLGADAQLEAVGEDDLDAHMQAPIFAQLTLESQEYLREDEFDGIDPDLSSAPEESLGLAGKLSIAAAILIILGAGFPYFMGWSA